MPLENINKVAGPFVEAWALEQFENVADSPNNEFELINAQAGKRLDTFDIPTETVSKAVKQAAFLLD